MKRLFSWILLFTFALLSGCNDANIVDTVDLDELGAYEVKHTSDIVAEDDFIFGLTTGEAEYEMGEEVTIYGELYYKGDKEVVTIGHSSSAIIFTIEEKIRQVSIPGVVQEIGMETTLQNGEKYRKSYSRNGEIIGSDLSEEEEQFTELFLTEDEFPSGYYVVHGVASFYFESKRYDIEAEIDFKVYPK